MRCQVNLKVFIAGIIFYTRYHFWHLSAFDTRRYICNLIIINVHYRSFIYLTKT